MKNIPQIVVFLLLLTHVSLRAVPDPLELQQVAEEIRQSVLERIQILSIGEVERAVWDIADGISADDLKQFFPKGCRNFKAKGSFTECNEMNVVRTWFTYADFSFLCVFWATFSTSSLKRIGLFSNDADDVRVLWVSDPPLSTDGENLISN